MKMKSIIFLAILHVGGITEANILFQNKSEIDPKEAFFKHFRFYDSQEKSKSFELDDYQNIPLPGGFQLIDEERLKRSYHVLPFAGVTTNFQTNLPQEKLKHKRIKRQSNVSYLFQEANNDAIVKPLKDYNKFISQDTGKHDLIINDFIRFKRQVGDNLKGHSEIINGRQDREAEVRTKKMMVERDLSETRSEREREARGATKEQWIKQPYPVERPVEDNVASASLSASVSDSIRAPRVHFVTTHRRGLDRDTQPAPGAPYHRTRMHDEREGRAREPQSQPHYQTYPYPHPPYLHPQPHPHPRSYEPRYYDPYFQHFDERDRRYGFDAFAFDDGRSMLPPPPPPPLPPFPPANKQRRIIYYATLPEVVRSPTPPHPSHGEQRYSYRSGYEADRYSYNEPEYYRTSTAANSVNAVNARNKKQYERPVVVTTDQTKTPLYPVKVATDVNVREPKKNPERRIYSEADRRFTYKQSPSFQLSDDGNF